MMDMSLMMPTPPLILGRHTRSQATRVHLLTLSAPPQRNLCCRLFILFMIFLGATRTDKWISIYMYPSIWAARAAFLISVLCAHHKMVRERFKERSALSGVCNDGETLGQTERRNGSSGMDRRTRFFGQ